MHLTAVHAYIVDKVGQMLGPMSLDLFKVSEISVHSVARTDGDQVSLAARSSSPAVEMFFQLAHEQVEILNR